VCKNLKNSSGGKGLNFVVVPNICGSSVSDAVHVTCHKTKYGGMWRILSKHKSLQISMRKSEEKRSLRIHNGS
jgi:hypothetical protein